MEEKGEGGVHWSGSVWRTHSLTLSHSLRARLAGSHRHARTQTPGSSGARRSLSAASKLLGLALRFFLLWGVLYLLGASAEPTGSCPCAPLDPGAAGRRRLGLRGLSVYVDNNSGGRPLARRAKRVPAWRGPGTRARFCLPDARPARSPRATPASASCPGFAPLAGGGARTQLLCKTPSRRLELFAVPAPIQQRLSVPIQDLQNRGRPAPGRDAGRSPALCHERRLAAPWPGLAAPGRPGRPDETPAGCGRSGGRGRQVPAPLGVHEPPGLPQPSWLTLQPAAPSRRSGGWRQLWERAGAQPHRRLPAAASGRARTCVSGAVHPYRPGAALQGRRQGRSREPGPDRMEGGGSGEDWGWGRAVAFNKVLGGPC